MTELTPQAISLLQGKNFASLATVMKDGSPQTSVIWVDTDGTHVVFNTAEGRLKTHNMRRDARVAVAVPNSENPYEQVLIRGRVVEMTHDGADAHIDAMAKKYLDQDSYPFRAPGEVRVLVKVLPERVSAD